jgi:hypothetical protein
LSVKSMTFEKAALWASVLLIRSDSPSQLELNQWL